MKKISNLLVFIKIRLILTFYISWAYERCYNVIPSIHYFYIKTKMFADFQIYISIPLKLLILFKVILQFWSTLNLQDKIEISPLLFDISMSSPQLTDRNVNTSILMPVLFYLANCKSVVSLSISTWYNSQHRFVTCIHLHFNFNLVFNHFLIFHIFLGKETLTSIRTSALLSGPLTVTEKPGLVKRAIACLQTTFKRQQIYVGIIFS